MNTMKRIPRRGITTLMNRTRKVVEDRGISGVTLARESGISTPVAHRLLNNSIYTIAKKTEFKLRAWLDVNDKEKVVKRKPLVSLAMPNPDPHGVGRDVLKVRREIDAHWKALGWERDSRPSIGGFADELRLLRALTDMYSNKEKHSATDKLEKEIRIKDDNCRVLRKTNDHLQHKVAKQKKVIKKLIELL